MSTLRYAVIVESHAVYADSHDNRALTKEGERFWLTRCEWVEATATRKFLPGGGIPPNLLTFGSREEASAFYVQWRPHPWFVDPTGDVEFVPVAPVMVSVQKGWKLAGERGR